MIIPTAAHTLDCFNTRQTVYFSGTSFFHLVPTDTLNNLFVAGLYSYIYKNCFPYDDTIFLINSESLRAFLGYSRGGKSKKITQELEHLCSQRCVIDGTVQSLATVTAEGRLITIQSPYFNRLSAAMKQYSIRSDGTEGSRYTSVVYANILTVKSKAAAEVCIELCKLIERRGGTDTAHIAVKTLIQRCPTLFAELTALTSNSRKNQYLKYAITKGAGLLTTHTSTYAEYADLSVMLPEKITLINGGDAITISHKGKNIEKRGLHK